ncbi:MAG: glutamate--tRNA ligase [Acidobacteria bacterium]|nr:glutamate--tRNA ligase [Acidobacteriota bacterium]
MTPRLRFAPSPTGYLHVGGARTALFNWLYARRHGGTFVLRIEDTDTQRSSDDMVSGILDGLRWLGIDWDEGPEVGGPHAPYFQSQRLDRYRAAVSDLVSRGCAYEDDGAIRFRVPQGTTTFHDEVHGPISFDNAHLESFVILRSDGHPTYHLSVVVDDIDMGITHVVRGDDHISNTPKHVLLFEAFGATPPRFAHVPLIMGADKKRLSKRHGATSVLEYERQGYLPDALFNFLALLGWGTGTDDELLSREELVQRFTLDGISGGNAVFNTDKLDWFNHQYLLKLSDDALVAHLRPFLIEAGLWRDAFHSTDHAWLVQVLALLRPRAQRLTEFATQFRPFCVAPTEYDTEGVRKHLSASDSAAHITALAACVTASAWNVETLERDLRALAEARGIKAAVLIHAARLAVTGRMVSPGLFDMLVLIGRNAVVTRLQRLARQLPLPVAPSAAAHE